jgi:hypothetical protein
VAALRHLGERAVAAGGFGLDQIRESAPEACTLVPRPFSAGADHKAEKTGPASVAALVRLVE